MMRGEACRVVCGSCYQMQELRQPEYLEDEGNIALCRSCGAIWVFRRVGCGRVQITKPKKGEKFSKEVMEASIKLRFEAVLRNNLN